MRLAALHFTPRFGAVALNRARLLAGLHGAADVDLVVLPELATTGFCLAPEEAEEWAEELTGPTVQALRAWARATGTLVACGLALREGARLSNAQVLIEADGELAGVYRKRHLWGHDVGWATPGDEPGGLTQTRLGLVGQLICADIGHLETVLALTQRRPRLLAFSTAWVGEGEPFPVAWQIALRLLDPAPLVAANRGGDEEGVTFGDPSAILAYGAGGVVGPRSAATRLLRWEGDVA